MGWGWAAVGNRFDPWPQSCTIISVRTHPVTEAAHKSGRAEFEKRFVKRGVSDGWGLTGGVHSAHRVRPRSSARRTVRNNNRNVSGASI